MATSKFMAPTAADVGTSCSTTSNARRLRLLKPFSVTIWEILSISKLIDPLRVTVRISLKEACELDCGSAHALALIRLETQTLVFNLCRGSSWKRSHLHSNVENLRESAQSYKQGQNPTAKCNLVSECLVFLKAGKTTIMTNNKIIYQRTYIINSYFSQLVFAFRLACMVSDD